MAAQVLADRLPEAYTDDDRAVISHLWTPRVDWNKIEEQGSDSIPAELERSLAEVLKVYGTHRGALVQKTTKEIEARVPEAKAISKEAAVKGIMEKDWSGFKDGKPVMSDDDFASAAAELLRRTRQG